MKTFKEYLAYLLAMQAKNKQPGPYGNGGGAGDIGTDELVNKYKRETPGQ